MKRENIYSMVTIMGILITMFLTGCGGSSGGGGAAAVDNGGAAKGTFKKSIVYNTTSWAVLFSDYSQLRFHLLYRADDISGSGNITAIRFRLDTDLLTDVSCGNVTLKLGHSSVTDLTTTFADAIETGKGSFVTVIDNAAINIPADTAGAYIEIQLSETFNYNGVDNLLLEISRTSACSGDVILDAGSAIGYDATLSSLVSASAVSGSVYDYNMTTSFQFSGGDNEVDFGSVGQDTYPFSTALPKVQILYTNGEINGSGPISGIGFQMYTTSVQNDVTYTLKLGHTSTLLSTTFADNFDTGTPVTLADNVSFTIPAGIPAGEYFWLPIPDGTFTYNGTDILLLEIDVSAATDLTYVVSDASEPGRRAVGNSGEATASGTDNLAYNIKFRFSGAPVQVMPSGNGAALQVLGGLAGGGQMQSLYTPTVVGTGGAVTSISLRLKADSVGATIPNYKIYMGGTAKTELNIADIYSSNMELNSTLVFNGSFDIPAGLKEGDWIKIPLQTGYTYDPTENMTILFMADSASPSNNPVSASFEASFPSHMVGRSDNAVGIDGVPVLDIDALVDVQLNISQE